MSRVYTRKKRASVWLCHLVWLGQASCKFSIPPFPSYTSTLSSAYSQSPLAPHGNGDTLMVLEQPQGGSRKCSQFEPPSPPRDSGRRLVLLEPMSSSDEYHLIQHRPRSEADSLGGIICFNKGHTKAFLFDTSFSLKAILSRSILDHKSEAFEFTHVHTNPLGEHTAQDILKIHVSQDRFQALMGITLNKNYVISQKTEGGWRDAAVIVIPMLGFHRDLYLLVENSDLPSDRLTPHPLVRVKRNPLRNEWKIEGATDHLPPLATAPQRGPTPLTLPSELIYLLPGFFVLRDYAKAQLRTSLKFMDFGT